jgi:hypothetical protein
LLKRGSVYTITTCDGYVVDNISVHTTAHVYTSVNCHQTPTAAVVIEAAANATVELDNDSVDAAPSILLPPPSARIPLPSMHHDDDDNDDDDDDSATVSSSSSSSSTIPSIDTTIMFNHHHHNDDSFPVSPFTPSSLSISPPSTPCAYEHYDALTSLADSLSFNINTNNVLPPEPTEDVIIKTQIDSFFLSDLAPGVVPKRPRNSDYYSDEATLGLFNSDSDDDDGDDDKENVPPPPTKRRCY